MVDAPVQPKQAQWLANDEIRVLTDEPRLPFALAFGVCLRAPVQKKALQRALDAVVQRHGALRSAFMRTRCPDRLAQLQQFLKDRGSAAGLFRHVVHTSADFRLRVVDGPPLSAEQRHQIGRELFMELFDTERAPLARAVLMPIAPDTEELLLIVSHVIADRESMNVLSRDVTFFYRHFVSGHEPPPRPSANYADAWTRISTLEEHERRRSTDYWVRQWAFARKKIPRPDRTTREPQTERGPRPQRAVEVVTLDESRLAALLGFARRHRTTLYVVLLAALADALARWTRHPSVGVWINVDNRWRAGSGDLVAWTSNSQLFSADIARDVSPASLVKQVRRAVVEAIEHSHTSLIDVCFRTGEPPPDLEPWVIFDVFRLDDAVDEGADASVREIAPGVTFEFGDIVVNVYVRQRSARCIVNYATNIVSADAAREFVRTLDAALRSLSADADGEASEGAVMKTAMETL